MKKDFLDITSFSQNEIIEVLSLALMVKKNPKQFSRALAGKTLLMLFAKPSLRTRLSFETAMTQLGGHAIYYDLSGALMGKKESIADTAKSSSRYVDAIMARLFEHSQIQDLALFASVPVINGLTDFSHPCQILSDLLTIKEYKGTLEGLKLAFLGDGNNNVTHSLISAAGLMGFYIQVACPFQHQPQARVVEQARIMAQATAGQIEVTNDPKSAVKEAGIVYTDSWMSYHIPEAEKERRVETLKPFQVTPELMAQAKPSALFMHCLPAQRGLEVAPEVIDGPQSIVFPQAENRLHLQKALLLKLLS